MPSAEPADCSSEARECANENGDYSTEMITDGALMSHESPDPDRHLIPGDRIEHDEEIDLPTVREFTQNDTINKFLLNSFLQRINDSTEPEGYREAGAASSAAEEQEQDFDS
ncbi:uncharacterized protein LOC118507838 [Anopheles stephensi]|uniref:Uncharacterized protein n=1 Tax=Anopheles stephensi TaxID=30069 RepID=A0A182YEU1_ANOST|nr:uncharacterized protein LOC118507838 [Anopheles stephensi]